MKAASMREGCPLEAGETGGGLKGARELKCKRGKFQLLSAVLLSHPAF